MDAKPEANHFDVVIVGAGISGIGTACHLQRECPDKTFVLLEGREDFGGTWDLFRYPGIRSDSDMHTLGFSFKPWLNAKAIADGPSIKEYLGDTIRENHLHPHIRFSCRVTEAAWSSETATWTVRSTDKRTGEAQAFTCNFLSMCAGYYSYKQGFTPTFEGKDDFSGTLVHPQHWPEDLDYTGKKVVVIGSGATAMTLVPAMASDVEHVTMLQRSPTYVVSRPDKDWIANTLRKFLPEKLAYRITRMKNIGLQGLFYRKARSKPEKAKKQLLQLSRKELGDQIVDDHFTPSYNPWDQRLCLIPNGDLYEAINSGKASVVTEHIDRFVEDGIRLKNGEVLEADIIVTATGLNLVVLGEMDFSMDGERIDFADTWTYRGLMYSGVPNMMSTFGYINASWTLRSDLTAEYLCRILNHMDAVDANHCVPQLRATDQDMPRRAWIENFSSGYMSRAMDKFPKQGDREPWVNPQDYKRERKTFRAAAIDDGCLRFSKVAVQQSDDNETAQMETNVAAIEADADEKVALTAIVP